MTNATDAQPEHGAMLLLDIGNTRLKWASLETGELGVLRAIPHAQLTRSVLIETVLAGARPARVLAANVAGERMRELVDAAVRAHWNLPVEFAVPGSTAAGVTNGYRDPQQLGVDRWLAMVGAFRMFGGPAIVASAGTALTIDALDARGVHLGGLIAPGLELMTQSLFAATSDIAQRAKMFAGAADYFADNTFGAVEQGALQAAASLIDRSVRVLEERVGSSATLVLTGGASEHIAAALLHPARTVADLVMRGLAVLAADR